MSANSKTMQQDSDQDGPITLGILNAVQDNSELTQRSVASDLGIALGLANSYLKRCVRKGLVKIKQAPANRYSYYLTPKGFAEKSRLTADYLTHSFTFYRRARIQCSDLLDNARAEGAKKIALYRVSDLAEIMALCALESETPLEAVIDSSVRIERFCGLPIVDSLDRLESIDAVIMCDLLRPQQSYEALLAMAGDARILYPPLLGIAEPRAASRSDKVASR
ncbi:MAG: winged helix-turn-helix transcriptional regulator [Alphaproteobacteria bacterium]